MATNYTRRITLYINDKEVKNNIGSIQKEYFKANNELKKMELGSEEYIKQMEKVAGLKSILNDHNQALNQSSGFLGKLQGKLELMPGSFGKMASGIISVGKAAAAFFLTPVGAIIGIIAAIGMGAKALIKNSMEFSKAASSLSAITGATGKDLDFLKQKAKEISRESTQSATDMLKAFEKIGSDLPALLSNGPLLAEVTKNAVALSEATGGELSVTDAAKAAAGAMNQFNIPLTESGRAVNALAAGALVGSAGIMEINESMKNSGAVMNGANMSLEESVALYEVLATKQLKGAEAGTAARGVIMKLQAAGVGYASGQFNMRDALIEANAKIDAQKTALEKDALAQKLFGQEGITAGKILLDNVEMYDSLTKAVTGTNAAYDQQKIQNDNLTTSNKKLKEAWTNLMLGMEDGTGIFAKTWKFFIDGLTADINLISGIIDKFRSKESREKRAEIKAARDAEQAKRDELMATAKQFGLIVDEKISLAELEQKVNDEKAKQQLETEKLLNEKKAEEAEKQRKAADEKQRKAADEKQKLDEAKANAAIAASEREYERKRMLIEENIFDETEKNKALEALEIAKSADTVKMLENRLKTEKLTAVERVNLEADIEKEKFELEKKLSKQRIDQKKTDRETELKDLDNLQKTELANLKKQGLEQGLADDEIKGILLNKELDFLWQKLWIREKNGEDISAVEADIAAKEAEIADNSLAIAGATEKQRAELKKKYLEDNLTNEQKRDAELIELEKAYNTEALRATEEYQKLKTAITKKYEKDRFDIATQYLSAADQFLSLLMDASNARKDKELKLAGDNAAKKEAIERKYAKSQQKIQIGQALIAGAMAVLQIWKGTTTGEPISDTIIKGILSALVVGKTAVEISTIKNQQFKTGGHTARSASDSTPVGVVHANEWVASAPLLRNPETRRHIDYLEAVQRGITPRFNTSAISSTMAGFQSGGFSSPTNTANRTQTMTVIQQTDPALINAIERMNESANRLADKPLDVNANEIFNKKEAYDNSVSASEY